MSRDNNHNTISVIVTTYNSEHFIIPAIECILNQTRAPEEIIIIDDGSDDNTYELVRNLHNPKIRYYFQENSGVSSACNSGILHSNCDWVAFLDVDDLWLPDKLMEQMELLSKNKELVWSNCNGYYVNHKINQTRLILEDEILPKHKQWTVDFLKFGKNAGIWTRSGLIIRRKIIANRLFDCHISAGEDLDLCLRVAYDHPKIGLVTVPLIEYNAMLHDRLSFAPISKQLDDLFKVADKHLVKEKLKLNNEDLKNLFRPRINFWYQAVMRENKYFFAFRIIMRYRVVFTWREISKKAINSLSCLKKQYFR